jgi:NAD(P)-dependent dehydrogenase (short-subunit alcohol dehydrogenase family)
MSFANQVVLITGAAQGIGRQLALQLAREDAIIAAVDLDAEPLKALEVELGGKRCASAVADVTDRPALLTAVKELEGRLGPVDLLIASAGIGRETPALTFQAEAVEAHIRINLIGVANSVEAVLPGMLARQSGHLVGISSLASYRGFPRMAGYCASKAGLNALCDSLRVELASHGIAVTVICPGWIRTRMTANVAVKMENLLEVEDATRLMIEAIRRRRPYYTFPARGAWRCRLLQWLPARISDWLVARQFRRLTQTGETP